MAVRPGRSKLKNSDRKIIAIIPARGGSKGIPRKNIADLCGMPLIAYSIVPAIKSGVFDRVIVTTDDPEIAECAEKFGAEVPFLRPASLATDNANALDAIDHAMDVLFEREGYEPWGRTVFFPSYPFRTVEDIRLQVRLLKEGYSSVSFCRLEAIMPERFVEANTVGRLVSNGLLFPQVSSSCSRAVLNTCTGRIPPWSLLYGTQDSTRRWSSNGKLLRWYNSDEDIASARAAFGRIPVAYIKADEIRAFDVDSPDDLELASEIIKRGWFDMEGPACSEWLPG